LAITIRIPDATVAVANRGTKVRGRLIVEARIAGPAKRNGFAISGQVRIIVRESAEHVVWLNDIRFVDTTREKNRVSGIGLANITIRIPGTAATVTGDGSIYRGAGCYFVVPSGFARPSLRNISIETIASQGRANSETRVDGSGVGTLRGASSLGEIAVAIGITRTSRSGTIRIPHTTSAIASKVGHSRDLCVGRSAVEKSQISSLVGSISIHQSASVFIEPDGRAINRVPVLRNNVGTGGRITS